ncbi:MAG: T9SS type A sorting domain-containing protein [Bacteroidota bacterium]
MKKLCTLLLFVILAGIAKGQIITTIAGTGMVGYNGDNIFAKFANISACEVCVDILGNIYIADLNNNRVRKVNATNGIITTVAGTGVAGFNGDNIPATTAQLNGPYGVAIDALGNLFIADDFNARIRKVDATTGIISTIAGNGIVGYSGDKALAINAELYSPNSLMFDHLGNLYLSDNNNHVVRRINMTTGIITTVVGNGTNGFSGDNGLAISAQLANPYGIVFDSSDNLYIADAFNFRVRKVDAITGIITTIAGNGNWTYSGDNVLATTTAIWQPYGLAIDTFGNLFISDHYNQRIRKVDATTGIITTVAGTGTNGFSGDNGLATSAQVYNPIGLGIDKCNNLYIADATNNRIRKVWIGTTTIPTASIGVSPNDTVCAGAAVSYTAMPSNAGSTPSYQWLKNGAVIAGATNSTYTYTPANGDSVQCILVSSVPCAGPALSNAIHMVLSGTAIVPTISITGNATVLMGASGTYTATTNVVGGTYQWKVNNNNVGTNSNSYTYVPVNGDVVTCSIHSAGGCYTVSDTISNGISILVTEGVGNVHNNGMSIYPNPTNDVLHIDGVKGVVNYRVLNIVGGTVQEGVLKVGSNSVAVQGLSAGMYLLEITDAEGVRNVVRVVRE